MLQRTCPALLITAPASHQGKTLITAGLAAYYRKLGKNVRVFKVGPDFLDPMILERASGNPVYQLDLWMMGEQHCRQLLYEAAENADVILVEGVMGLYDGQPSTADLAVLFDLPVLFIIDASGTAETFHAVVQGLATFNSKLRTYGAVANHVASQRHAQLLCNSAELGTTVRYLGAVFKSNDVSVPSRYLGLVQAGEIDDLDRMIEASARSIEALNLNGLPPPVHFSILQDFENIPLLLTGRRIAVARDAAFSFLYRRNLDLLEKMGAGLLFFSPLKDSALPVCDCVYLPGGYPELHLDRLENNVQMKEALRLHLACGKNIYAECGGMLYLLQRLIDQNGRRANMSGLIPGSASVSKSLQSLGYHTIETSGGAIRGHTFHYSNLQLDCVVEQNVGLRSLSVPRHHEQLAEVLHQTGGLFASYVHLYFPSNPIAAAQFLGVNVDKRNLRGSIKFSDADLQQVSKDIASDYDRSLKQTARTP